MTYRYVANSPKISVRLGHSVVNVKTDNVEVNDENVRLLGLFIVRRRHHLSILFWCLLLFAAPRVHATE